MSLTRFSVDIHFLTSSSRFSVHQWLMWHVLEMSPSPRTHGRNTKEVKVQQVKVGFRRRHKKCLIRNFMDMISYLNPQVGGQVV